jgi:hypothetical protein
MRKSNALAIAWVIALGGCGGVASTGETQAALGSTTGSGGDMPAFYDDHLFTINFVEKPASGEAAVLAHNKSINIIYQSDFCTPPGQMMFISVINALRGPGQGPGFNPLWQEVQIRFDNPNFPCQQLTSDNAIVADAAAGLITLVPTTEVYRCAVVGTTP